MEVRIETLEARRVASERHHGDPDAIEETRRPMYQRMIMEELVAGPSVLRFRGGADGPDGIDVLIGCAAGFHGDEHLDVEVLPEGRYAVVDYEGPPSGLRDARRRLMDWAEAEGHEPDELLQVHVMDELEGETEQQFQVHLR